MYSSEFQLGNAQEELEVYIQDKEQTEGTFRKDYVTEPWNAYVIGSWCYSVRVEETVKSCHT